MTPDHRAIATSLEGIWLEPLREGHSDPIYELMQSNREHLTRHGDYAREVARDRVETGQDVARSVSSGLAFVIVDRDEVVGFVELVPVAPPRYGCGYWLTRQATGRGIATAALAAAVERAPARGATDVFAGVTHGNDASAAVLRRVGFSRRERFETYDRYHLDLRRIGSDEPTRRASRRIEDARSGAVSRQEGAALS